MRLCYLAAALLFCAALTHAQILNVTAEDIEVPAYSNTNSYVKLLNLSLNLTGIDSVSITSINVTFNSTASINANATNLTACAFNETFDAISCNSTWSGNTTVLNMNYEVTNATERTLYIGYYINRSLVNLSVIHGLNVSLYISSNESITLNDTSVLKDNSTFPLSSRFTQIQDLHAVASISPHYVDTNVKNQSFRVIVNITSYDVANKTIIYIPAEFTNVNLVDCMYITGNNNEITGCGGVWTVSNNQIHLTDITYYIKYLRVNFTADTNQSGEFTRTFNASVSGGNLTDIPVSESSSGALNVTTKQLINNVTITSVKNTAYITSDGSDYWEFNFTVNITANVSGLLQFKMNNWYSPSKNATINLTNGTAYYAKLWKSDEPSNTINVTTEYGDASKGISLSNFSGLLRLTLRMYIPPTVQAVTNDWYTLYWILFRTLP